jgi:hypothetical protein
MEQHQPIFSHVYVIEQLVIYSCLFIFALASANRWNGLAKATVVWAFTKVLFTASLLFSPSEDVTAFSTLASIVTSSILIWEIALTALPTAYARLLRLWPRRSQQGGREDEPASP